MHAGDWQRNFRQFDPKGSFYDRTGARVSYDQLLALAPPDAPQLVTDEAMAARFDAAKKRDGAAARDRAGREPRLPHHMRRRSERSVLRSPAARVAVYHGATIRNAKRREVAPDAWYKRAQMLRLEEHGDVHYPVEQSLALHIIGSLVGEGFDIAASSGLAEDQYEGHAFSFIHRFYLDGMTLPIVPVFLNTYFPPNQPTPARCIALGQALRRAVDSFPAGGRVGFMASGGLSHFQAEEDLDQPCSTPCDIATSTRWRAST